MARTFGEVVRDARTARALTLQRVADEIGGIDHPRLSRIERGHVRPTAREVDGLVRTLDLDPREALELAAQVRPDADARTGA